MTDTPVRLWLDDVRYPPDDTWTWVKTVAAALAVMAEGQVTELALDNDLHPFDRDGTEVCDWMIDNDIWPSTVHVITSNNFASTYMSKILRRNGYESEPGRLRTFRRKTPLNEG